MGNISLQVFQELTASGETRERASIIAKGFEGIEYRFQPRNEAFTREDARTMEVRLMGEIDKVRLETEKVRNEVHALEVRMVREFSRHTWLMLGGMTTLTTLLRVLDHFGI